MPHWSPKVGPILATGPLNIPFNSQEKSMSAACTRMKGREKDEQYSLITTLLLL